MTSQIGYNLTKDQAVQSDIEAGTASKMANAAAIRAAMPYTKSFVSTEQTITGASNATIAHGLSGQPFDFNVVLRCKTAEFGYAVGEELDCGSCNGTGIINVTATTTNLIVTMFSSTIPIYNKAIFSSTNLTAANWRIVAKARG